MKKNKLREYARLLGAEVRPLVRRKDFSASRASSILHGANDMHRSCHMDSDRVSNMVELAMAEKRKEYKEQTWEVYAVYSDGTFQLLSNLGYSIDGVDRKSFRVIKTYL